MATTQSWAHPKPGDSSFFWASHVGTEVQEVWPSFAAFSDTVARRWIELEHPGLKAAPGFWLQIGLALTITAIWGMNRNGRRLSHFLTLSSKKTNHQKKT